MSGARKSNNQTIIIVIGPPGSGKGTQAILLADKLGLYYFETSKIVELNVMNEKREKFQTVEGKKYFFENEKKIWEEGGLCSPPLVSFWVKEKINNLAQENRGIVFAGSPRTLYEAEKIMPLLKKLYGKKNIKIILFELAEKESMFRNSHRRICELFRHPVLYKNENRNLKTCPLDGSKLLKRKKLDDPKTIKVRLKAYKEQTLPIINYFTENKYNVMKVDASPSPSDVFQNIMEKLKGQNV